MEEENRGKVRKMGKKQLPGPAMEDEWKKEQIKGKTGKWERTGGGGTRFQWVFFFFYFSFGWLR